LKLAAKLASADVPPEKAYHPKRSEEEMSKTTLISSMISNAVPSRWITPLDMIQPELLGAINRSMVDMETARARNKEYEDARKVYKQFLNLPPGTPSIKLAQLYLIIFHLYLCCKKLLMLCPWLNVAHRTMFHVDLCDLWTLAGLKAIEAHRKQSERQ